MALMVDMSDYDLTDRYMDERSSATSSIAGRHPRGDSPDRYFDTDGSVTGDSSTSGRAGSVTSSLGSRRQGGMPSLSRLMAYLDDEPEDADDQRQTMLRADQQSPTRVSPPLKMNVDRGTLPTHLSPTKYEQPDSVNLTSQIQHTAQAPAPQAPRTFASGSSFRGEVDKTNANSFSVDGRTEMSWRNGPSLHESQVPPSLQYSGELPAFRAPGSPSVTHGKDAQIAGGISGSLLEGGAQSERPSQLSGRNDGGSHYNSASDAHETNEDDTILQLAEEVIKEFDSIVSRNREETAPIEEPMASVAQGRPSPVPPPMVPGEADLLEELRMARAHIGRLQDELRAVSSAVVDLQSREKDLGRGCARFTSGSQSKQQSRLSREDEATLRVAQHLLAVHSLPSNDVQHINTIEQALRFVRQIDALVHHRFNDDRNRRDEGFSNVWRREEAVFSPANLALLTRRVEGWQRIAGGRDGARG